MSRFGGVQAAAITPRGKHGEVDFGAAFELIDYLGRAGVDGIALFAAEGEYHAFTAAERARLCYLAVKRSRVPILAGVGGATLDESVELAREARDAGAAGLLVPPPYFFDYDQDDLRAFYLQFAAQAGNAAGDDTPILLYQTRATSRIAPETARELLEAGPFTALVHAAGDAEDFQEFHRAGPLLGDDVILTADGCGPPRGVLSGAACAVPEMVVGVARAIEAGAQPAAARGRGLLRELIEWSGRFPQPTLWKAATECRKLKTGPIAAALSQRKRRELDEFREWFRDWLPRTRHLSANA